MLALGFAIPPTPRRTTQGATTTWVYDFGQLDAYVHEANEPADVIDAPHLEVSTRRSWAAIAHDYRAIVDAQIAAGAPTLPARVDGRHHRLPSRASRAGSTA